MYIRYGTLFNYEQNNSLNYCKLKFDIDTSKVEIQRLKNRVSDIENNIDNLQSEIEKELEISLSDVPTSESVHFVKERINHILLE